MVKIMEPDLGSSSGSPSYYIFYLDLVILRLPISFFSPGEDRHHLTYVDYKDWARFPMQHCLAHRKNSSLAGITNTRAILIAYAEAFIVV